MKLGSKYKITFLIVSILITKFAFSQKPKDFTPAPNPSSPEKQITVCHLTNDYQIQSLIVPASALNAHLAHGDMIGGCSADNSPLKLSFSTTDVKCNAGNDGAIDLSVLFSNGNPPINIHWSNGAVSEDVANLTAGIYSVTVSISNHLSATVSIKINEPEKLSVNLKSTDVSCAEKNDGIVAIFPEGGVFPYTTLWSENAGNQKGNIAYNLSKGNYRVTVMDSNGCIAATDISVNEPSPLNMSIYSTNESCSGNDGNALATVSGGTSPYFYQWDEKANFQTDAMAGGLAQGTYSIGVTDKNKCSVSANVTVNKNACGCQLRNEDCGSTVVSLGQFIYCNPIQNATNYQWEFSNSQFNFLKTIQRGNSLNNFFLTWVPGIQYGKTYDVRIKPLVNGVWKDYGIVCRITVPAPIPYTKLRNEDCGISTTSLSQQLFCDFVAGTQNYQWEFSNSEMGFYQIVNRGSNSVNFTLGWVMGIQYGKTYEVRVRANVGGEWGNFGNVCTVSLIYPIPVTKVRFADCGIILSSLAQNIFCDAVSGASDYQWEISNSNLNFSSVMNRAAASTNFQFGWISNIQYQTTYDVRVRAKVAGEWAEFASVCQITTPNAPMNPRIGNSGNEKNKEEENNIAEKETKFSVYPNPNNGNFNLKISAPLNSGMKMEKLKIYNLLGEIVYSDQLPTTNYQLSTNLQSGIYILNVFAEGKNYTEKIIVR